MKIALDCDSHSSDNENIRQKAKLLLLSVVKRYFLKASNYMEHLLRGNNSEHFDFTHEPFHITKIYMKTDISIAPFGINIDDVT